jgi:chromosome segregation ATPase
MAAGSGTGELGAAGGQAALTCDDPDDITELAGRFRMVGETGDALFRIIDSIAGSAADAVSPVAGELYAELATAQPEMRGLVDAFQAAAAALDACATALLEARDQATTALADAEQASADIVAGESRQRLAEAERRTHQQAQDIAQRDADLVWARLAIDGSTLDPAGFLLLEERLQEHTMAAAQAADETARAGQQAAIAGTDTTSARSRLAAANGLAQQADECREAAAAAVVAALNRAAAVGPNLFGQRAAGDVGQATDDAARSTEDVVANVG